MQRELSAVDLQGLASIEFLVMQTPTLTNLLQGRTVMVQRRRYRKFRNDYQLELLAGMRAWRYWPHDRRRLVVFTRLGRSTQMDDDGLIGGMKPLRDALHLVGITLDDARKYAAFRYRQEKGLKGTIVRVYLLNDAVEPTAAVMRKWCATLGRSLPEGYE